MRFRFIDAERAGLAMPIFRLCRLLQVSVSGFYAWRNRGPSQRQLDDMVLLAHVRAAFRRSRESYGAERVHHELAENGIEVGRHRVARLMRGNGLSPKRKQKFKKTTDSQHNKAVASNLLDQNFSAEAPNEKWAADISYIWTAQGWLYLAVVSSAGLSATGSSVIWQLELWIWRWPFASRHQDALIIRIGAASIVRTTIRSDCVNTASKSQ